MVESYWPHILYLCTELTQNGRVIIYLDIFVGKTVAKKHVLFGEASSGQDAFTAHCYYDCYTIFLKQPSITVTSEFLDEDTLRYLR